MNEIKKERKKEWLNEWLNEWMNERKNKRKKEIKTYDFASKNDWIQKERKEEKQNESKRKEERQTHAKTPKDTIYLLIYWRRIAPSTAQGHIRAFHTLKKQLNIAFFAISLTQRHRERSWFNIINVAGMIPQRTSVPKK